MIRHPVLKDLAGSRKATKIVGVAVETRQMVIVAGTFVGYSLLCYYLADWLGFSAERTALAFCWVLPLAFLFAFGKNRDGKHLEWIVARKWLSLSRPKVLLFKRRDPANPAKPVRDSVQEALPAERFYWEMLRCKDGTYLVAFEVEPVALSLVGDTERGRVFAAACELYNAIDFPIVEITRSKEGSTARFARALRRTVSAAVEPDERELSDFTEEHLDWVEGTVPSYNIFERRGYVILPYNPSEEAAVGEGLSVGSVLRSLLMAVGFGGKPRPSKRDAKRRQREAEQAYAVLRGRAQVVFDGMTRMGCRIEALTESELLAFVKGQTTSTFEEDAGELPNPFDPVPLEQNGYELLPEAKRRALIEYAEAVREEAPHALGIGDLAPVSDKVAPDAVRIHPDYLRVEGRYHATLFVGEWADEVHFGMLEGLTRIEGRVKVVKFIEPRPKEEALKILGSRLASLRASARTADDGDVRTSQERDIALFTNEQAMAELTSDRQRYLELSTLVHCEADSEERLESLIEGVRTTLSSRRTEAKLAREEAWEGFLSCLPLGRNYMAPRYVQKGMLTNPLACLFSYSAGQVDHGRGVFVGVDQRSGAVMTLDGRSLTSPHSVIIGQTGGGKSFVMKALSTRQRMLGHRVVLVDPEGNSKYARVARDVGGVFAMIGPGSPHKINPFDIHADYMNISLLEDAAADDEDPEAARRRARASALDGKVQECTRMVSLMVSAERSSAVGGLSGAEAGYIEKAIYEAYARKGIDEDPSTHANEPPTLKDVFAALREHEKTNPAIGFLREKLYSWESGGLSKLFDSQTNIDLTNKYLVFQISQVKDRQKAPVMHAVLEFMSGILSNPDEPSDCYVDEGWSILKDPMSADFTMTMYRSGRARDNAMTLASQNPIEFMTSEQGQAILDLAGTHMIFRHEHRKAAEATAGIYDLAEEEVKDLLNLRPGEGYLVMDQNRIRMRVLGSEYEEALFNTSPRRERWAREYLAERARRREEKRGGRAGRFSNATPEEDLPGDAGPARSGGLGDPAGDGWQPYSQRSPAVGANGDTGRDSDGDCRGDDRTEEMVSGDHPLLPTEEDPMRLYALCGDGAAETAAALTELLSREAEREGLFVLAADACGGDLAAALAAEEKPPPDDYLVNGLSDPDALGPHVADSAISGALKVVPAPENEDLPAHGLLGALRGAVDVCVVACSDSSYAADWLLEADRVVGVGDGAQAALSAALGAENHRGSNGTLLATLGAGGDGKSAELHGRTLFSLGADAGTESGPVRSLALALAADASEGGAADDG